MIPFVHIVEVSGKGRGLVAARRIPGGTIVDSCPVMVIPNAESRGVVDRYSFVFGPCHAIALGLGSLMNHSPTPNVGIVRDLDDLRIDFVSLCEIHHGEELVLDYGYDPLEEKP